MSWSIAAGCTSSIEEVQHLIECEAHMLVGCLSQHGHHFAKTDPVEMMKVETRCAPVITNYIVFTRIAMGHASSAQGLKKCD